MDRAPPRVASPCVNICRMNPVTGWCEGCARTLDEIAAWSSLGDDAQRRVLAALPARRGPAAAPGEEHMERRAP